MPLETGWLHKTRGHDDTAGSVSKDSLRSTIARHSGQKQVPTIKSVKKNNRDEVIEQSWVSRLVAQEAEACTSNHSVCATLLTKHDEKLVAPLVAIVDDLVSEHARRHQFLACSARPVLPHRTFDVPLRRFEIRLRSG